VQSNLSRALEELGVWKMGLTGGRPGARDRRKARIYYFLTFYSAMKNVLQEEVKTKICWAKYCVKVLVVRGILVSIVDQSWKLKLIAAQNAAEHDDVTFSLANLDSRLAQPRQIYRHC
jgi:hypothetical protein